jgi:hypothetical protein
MAPAVPVDQACQGRQDRMGVDASDLQATRETLQNKSAKEHRPKR